MGASVLRKFDEIKGAKFITIKGYKSSSTGEIANHNINVNVDIRKAKEADLETLKNFPYSKLVEIANKVGADIETAKEALNELIISKERNLTNDNRTVQSKAQTDAYIQLGKGLKIHKDNMEVYISGFANQKTVIVEGEYKKVNSRPKTLVKKEIEKGLKMYKYRTFKLGNAEELKVTGSTIQLK